MRLTLTLALVALIGYCGNADAQGMNRKKQPGNRRASQSQKRSQRQAIAFPDLAEAVKPIESADEAVWKLAELMSFAYYPARVNTAKPAPARLYLPLRVINPSFNPDLGYDNAAGALLGQIDRLAEFPEVENTAKTARIVYLDRYKIGAFNQIFGNTPDASFYQFAGYLMRGNEMMKDLQRQLDLDEEKRKRGELVTGESLNQLIDLIEAMTGNGQGEGGIHDFLKKPATISGCLAFADMAAVDRQADLWKDSLLPLVIKADRKTDRKELVRIDGFWRPKGGRETFSRLDHFLLKNTSKESLKHVVVELLATNQWGGKAKHYYYFPTIAIGAENRLLAHPRWDKRNLDFTNTIELTYSVWADSGSEMDRSASLTNPRPNPDPEGWRKDFLKGDQLLAGKWEMYDLFARKGFPEPVASQ